MMFKVKVNGEGQRLNVSLRLSNTCELRYIEFGYVEFMQNIAILNLNQKCFLESKHACSDSLFKSELPEVQINNCSNFKDRYIILCDRITMKCSDSVLNCLLNTCTRG